MDIDIFMMVVGAVLTIGVPIAGGAFTMIFAELKTNRESISAHRTHVAENYSSKKDVKEMKDELIDFLQRIEDKIDRKQ